MNRDHYEARFSVNRVHLSYESKEDLLAGVISAYKDMTHDLNLKELEYNEGNWQNETEQSNITPTVNDKIPPKIYSDNWTICDIHNIELTHFCRKCEVAICQACRTSVDHKGHRTKKIAIAVNEKKEELVNKYIKKEKEKEMLLQRNLSFIEHEKAEFKTSCDEVVARIRQRCAYMKDVLDTIANNLVKDVYSKKKYCIQQFMSSQTELHTNLKASENKLCYLESLIDSTHNKYFLEKFKSYKTEQTAVDDMVPPRIWKEYVSFDYGCLSASSLSEIFGNVNFIVATDDGAFTYENKQQCGRLSCRTKQSFRCEQRNNVESDDDEQEIGPINAVTKYKDELWVSCGISGKQVSCVDEGGHTIKSFRLKFKLEDITCNAHGDLLVTVFKDKCIRKLSPKGAVSNFINVPFHPKGINVSNDGGILVCMSDSYSTVVAERSRRLVVKYTKEGEEERIYEYNGETKIFTRPCRVVENINGDICVIDKTKMGSGQVVILDRTGLLKTIYNGNKVKRNAPFRKSSSSRFSPSDIACDTKGRIFITESDNHKIHLLDKDGSYIGHFLTNESDFFCPVSVGTDHENHIWVGNEYGEIKMFSCEWQ